MRRATQQALSVPTFRTPTGATPIDCTAWVIGGVWPAELNRVTAETATLAGYLQSDLERIVASANARLGTVRGSGLPEPARQAEEARIINVARAFAVLRVESTVRQLRQEPLSLPPEYPSLTTRATVGGCLPVVPSVDAARSHTVRSGGGETGDEGADSHAETSLDSAAAEDLSEHFDVMREGSKAFDTIADDSAANSEVLDVDAELKDAVDGVDQSEPEVLAAGTARSAARAEPTGIESVSEVAVLAMRRESSEHRLRRLVEYIARQEPGLKWAVGQRADGTTLLVTDLAHGWIPPGVDLPAGVDLLEPQHRGGDLPALLGPTALSATYTPGDPFGNAAQFAVMTRTKAVRRAPEVEDLGSRLAEATLRRHGLPRIAHTIAKAGAAGMAVVEAELDVLRVHLDTVRYQLLARYPEAPSALLLDCLLLAATERVAAADQTSANYHFAWFQILSAATPELGR
jgi:hypothetical protein